MVTTADIPPGGEGKIDVTLNTKGRVGKLEKLIEVFSNDPEKPRLTLKIGGTVERFLDFDPPRLSLGNFLKGTTRTETVKLVAKEPDKVKLGEITVSDPNSVKAELVKGTGPLPDLKVTLMAGDRERSFSARVTLQTGLEKMPTIDLLIFGAVTGDLVLDKKYAYFPNYDEKNPPTFEIRVSSLGGKPFKVTKVEDPQGFVTGKADKKDKDVVVLLTLTKDANPPQGKVLIRTDRKDQEVLEVSYSARTGVIHPQPIGGPQNPNMPRVIEPIAPDMKTNRPLLHPMPLKPGIQRPPIRVQPGPPPPSAVPSK